MGNVSEDRKKEGSFKVKLWASKTKGVTTAMNISGSNGRMKVVLTSSVTRRCQRLRILGSSFHQIYCLCPFDNAFVPFYYCNELTPNEKPAEKLSRNLLYRIAL